MTKLRTQKTPMADSKSPGANQFRLLQREAVVDALLAPVHHPAMPKTEQKFPKLTVVAFDRNEDGDLAPVFGPEEQSVSSRSTFSAIRQARR